MTADTLTELSDALLARSRAARRLVAAIRTGDGPARTGTLWRDDVVIASEQSLPEADVFEILHADSAAKARLVGRDRGTNVAVLKIEQQAKSALPLAADPEAGVLALAFGADGLGGASIKLGIVSHVGAAWTSRAGGKIDRRIHLDLNLSYGDEGGPVLNANGSLLGISTIGPRGSALVIPASTIERVIDPLLAHGRIARGWLGLALQPVAVPESLRDSAGQESGLMVMSVEASGPGAAAGVVAGDIVLKVADVAATRIRRLAEALGPESIGKRLEVKLIRAGAITSVSATIAPRPRDG